MKLRMQMLLLAVGLAGPIPAGAGEMPTAREIVVRVMERDKIAKAQDAEGRFTWIEREISEELDSSGALKKKEERLFDVFPVGSSNYERLVRLNGKELPPDELEEERERERKFRADLQAKRIRGGRRDSVKLDAELMTRYRFTLYGSEMMNGHLCYVLAFEPASSDLPEKRRNDRVVNRLHGKVWVNQEDSAVARLDAQLVEPVKMWAGILASIRTMSASVTQVEAEKGVWIPDRFEMRIQGRIFVKSFNRHMIVERSGFKPAS